MNKESFLKQLEYLLSDLPEEEKRDALDYYRDYLEDAGSEEARVLESFGSPERIASMIRSDLSGVLKDGGEFTEQGYTDERFRDPRRQVACRMDLPEGREAAGGTAGGGNGRNGGYGENGGYGGSTAPAGSGSGGRGPAPVPLWKKVLLVVVILALSPMILGIGGGIIGMVTGAAGLILSLVLLPGLLAFSLLAAGGCVCAVGIGTMPSAFSSGLLCLGAGLVVLSIGLGFLALSFLFYGRFLPWLFGSLADAAGGMRRGCRKEAGA